MSTLIQLNCQQFLTTVTGELKNLPEISRLHESSGAILLVLSTVIWRHFAIGKRPDLYFDGLCDQENIRQHLPVNCSNIGHSYEAFTYLFGRKSFIHDLSANKYSIVDLLRKLESIWEWILGLRLFTFSETFKKIVIWISDQPKSSPDC